MQVTGISNRNYIEPGMEWLIVFMGFIGLDLDSGVLVGLDFYFGKIGREIWAEFKFWIQFEFGILLVVILENRLETYI